MKSNALRDSVPWLSATAFAVRVSWERLEAPIKIIGLSLAVCLICASSVRADQTWTVIADPPSGPGGGNSLATLVLLKDGRVLALQDLDCNSASYNPDTASWSVAANDPFGCRYYTATATHLADGRVLVAGGCANNLSGTEVSIYNALNNTWTQAGSLSVPRNYSSCRFGAAHTATLLDDGRVLVVGGCLNANNPFSAELYYPSSDSWVPAANTSRAYASHSAVLLNNGRVLVVGRGPLSEAFPAEIYNPMADTWTTTSTPPALSGWNGAGAITRLRDGRVLVVSDNGIANPLQAVIYDPSHDSWTVTPQMILPHNGITAVLLADGTVLVAGGDQGGTEVFHPDVNVWAPAPSMNAPRLGSLGRRDAVLLNDGGVLIVGGTRDSHTYPFAERFDQTPVLAGGRAAVDGFAGFGGVVSTKTTTLSPLAAGRQVALVVYTAVKGETVDPSTISLVFNGDPVSLVSPLPARGNSYAIVTLQSGRNVLAVSMQ